jgi:DNA polymerase-1
MTTLIADIEADNLLDKITTIWQISTIDADTGELRSYNNNTLPEGIQALKDADRLVMHNGLGYDLPALKKVLDVELDWQKCIDTLVLSKLGNPTRAGGHSLEAWAPRLDMELEKVQHEDWSRWSLDMERRCGVDCQITLGVWERLKGMLDVMPDAVATEHAVCWSATNIMRRGFRLDEEYCKEFLLTLLSQQGQQLEGFIDLFPPILVRKGKSKSLKTVNRAHPLRGQLEPGVQYTPLELQEFNPGSRQQIAHRLVTKYGWKPSTFTPSGQAEVTEEVLRELTYPEAEAFAEYLKTEKRISQISGEPKKDGTGGGWLHYVKDGRVHAYLNHLRAVTHRLSCSSPNLQQVMTEPEMRRAWVPTPGKVLIGVDAEGLELRCLAHYLHRHDGGEYGRILVEGNNKDGTDIHSVVQRMLGLYSRDHTKRVEYGWLYGAGDWKIGKIVLQDAQDAGKDINYTHLGIEPRPGKKVANSVVGKAIRRRLEEGVNGLGDLASGVRAQAIAEGKFRGLDGRPLWVRSPHSALNLLLQSAGIIVMKKAWSLISPNLSTSGYVEDQHYGIVMQVHDEFQIEADPEHADHIGQLVSECIVEAGHHLNFKCPLAGDYKIGTSWAETH